MRLIKYLGAGFATIFAIAGGLLIWRWQELTGFATGTQAYLFAYPLITTDLTRAGFLQKAGPWALNRFFHATRLPDHTFTEIVAPNVDTLYSFAVLDLAPEPLVLRLPDTEGRWLLMQVLDAWSNTIASAGTRLYGHAAKDYVIVGPDWKGDLPPGVVVFRSNTNLNWILGRTFMSGPQDYDAVHTLQQRYRLVPLSQYRPDIPEDEAPQGSALAPERVPVAAEIARLTSAEYFGKAASLMAHDAYAAPDDQPMLERLAQIGVVPGQRFEMEKLDPSKRRGIEGAVFFIKCWFHTRAPGSQGDFNASGCPSRLLGVLNGLLERAANVKNGWDIRLKIGKYGTDYPVRAFVALLGFGANLPEDAIYPSTVVDSEGRALHGANQYTLHFDKESLPPANVFWSLTLYDARGYLVDNELSRYAVGSLKNLSYNAGGSLDIWIQRDNPGAAREANWLPAPPGEFKLMLRLYGPTSEVLANRWAPPAIRRADGPS
jgi:hypothetical protein